ncbi:MAG: pseudouridine-5'-phosphate glycosidase [Geminicoccaceae bacterium]|nr:pseudouridine-5'-phosphate glycosidase [Geminicoccaceae bacterium]
MHPPVAFAPPVEQALSAGRPVVALETTIICHGIPRPDNARLAVEIDDAVRAAGAVPATTAVLGGRLRVGLERDEVSGLARRDDVRKCTTRELPDAIASGGAGATTVASTLFVAAMAGIDVMATGGIGGVHLQGERSLDVSADLEELARRPVIVVASGIKSILDMARTLERLETLGVPLIGYRCDEVPGFYTRSTGFKLAGVDHLEEIVARFQIQRRLGLQAALLVLQPPPEALAIEPGEMAELTASALDQARQAGIKGPDETPFLLSRIAAASDGRTVRLNRALAVANAALAGEIAACLCRTA